MSGINPFGGLGISPLPAAPPCQRCASPNGNMGGLCFACFAQQHQSRPPAPNGLSPLYTPPEPEPDSVWFGRYAKAQAENNGLRGRLDVAERRLAVLEDRLNEMERRMNDESRR